MNRVVGKRSSRHTDIERPGTISPSGCSTALPGSASTYQDGENKPYPRLAWKPVILSSTLDAAQVSTSHFSIGQLLHTERSLVLNRPLSSEKPPVVCHEISPSRVTSRSKVSCNWGCDLTMTGPRAIFSNIPYPPMGDIG